MRFGTLILLIVTIIGLSCVNFVYPTLFAKFIPVGLREKSSRLVTFLHLDNFLQKKSIGNTIKELADDFKQESSKVGIDEIEGLHHAIHKFEKLDVIKSNINEDDPSIEMLDREIVTAERTLSACAIESMPVKRAKLLEMNILSRIHELISWRKSCMASCRHASSDPLPENPFVRVPEVTFTNHRKTTEQSEEKKAIAIDEKNKQLLEQDSARRREYFSAAAIHRWDEQRVRIEALIENDLKQLDVVLTAAL
jgi:hypothetical protein